MNLSIIIPAYNEQDSLKQNLPAWIDFCKSKGWTLIIVNDGSTDKTRDILSSIPKSESIKIVEHKVNRGYGAAIKSGFNEVTTEFALTMDADGQHALSSIEDLIETQENTDADLVIGSRVENKHSVRSFGKMIIRWISRLLIPNKISDLNSGMKLYRTSLARKYLPLCPNSMAFSDVITLSFLADRNLVIETPITTHPRKTGKSTINLNTAFDTIIEIVNIVMLFNPLRIFLPLSLIFLLGGLIWGIPIVVSGRGVSVGAMLAIITGFLCLIIGLIAEQLSNIRMSLVLDKKENKLDE